MRDYDDDNRYGRRRRARKHTGSGIASFAVAIVAGLTEFTVVGVAFVIGASNPNGVDMNSSLAIGLALGVWSATVFALTGLGLAVAGLCQTRRNNTFAVLGLILNGLVVMCVLFWMIVGVLTG
jgi:hypothetical protein